MQWMTWTLPSLTPPQAEENLSESVTIRNSDSFHRHYNPNPSAAILITGMPTLRQCPPVASPHFSAQSPRHFRSRYETK